MALVVHGCEPIIDVRSQPVTDGLKCVLRAFGEQFGNSLYGDGMKTLPIQSLGCQAPDGLTRVYTDQLLHGLFEEYNTSKKGKKA